MSDHHILALDARVTAVEKKLRQMQGQRDQLLEALEAAAADCDCWSLGEGPCDRCKADAALIRRIRGDGQ